MKKRFSIKTKMYIFVVLTVIIVAVGTSAVTFIASADRIDQYYKEAASDNARNFASLVDGDYMKELKAAAASEEFQELRVKAEEEENEQLIEDYLKEHGLWDKYYETRRMITNFLANMDGVKYIYVVAHGDKDADHDMYLVDDEENPLYETGYYEEREEELRGMDLTALPEPTISNGDWGWLCSDFKPVYDSDGNCVCIVGCDFGMDQVMNERWQLLVYLIVGSLLLTAFVLTGAVLFINKVVVKPLDAMTTEMKKFKPEENISYQEAGVIDLNIRSRDEIGEIYEQIRTMQINTIDHLNDLSALQKDKQKAEKDIEDKDRQIGQLSKENYRDALTGVGSKSAYFKKTEELNRSIADGTAEFALVMVDLNDLKKVNDDNGHKAGDLYIKGCCQMICDAFRHSDIFRIGGDEFVVVLKGQDYAERKVLCEKLQADFEKTCELTDIEPWLRYSAAIGMAENASDDITVDLVFRRADKMMYENKIRFKQKHGSYR